MNSVYSFSGFAARLRRCIGAFAQHGDGISEEVFDELARGLFALQFEHNGPYRRFCEARGARPGTVAHWSEIPAIPTEAFKELELSCLSAREGTRVFLSSGTTKQRPSRHFHHAASLAIYEASLLPWFAAHVLAEESRTELNPSLPSGEARFIFLTPSATQAPHSSLLHMFDTVRREFGSAESVSVGRVSDDGAWTLDFDAALQALRQSCRANRPVVLLGTAFSYVHLADLLAERDARLALPPGSRALETGGYKGRSRNLPRAELHALLAERLGLRPAAVVSEYGMSELSSQAYDQAPGQVDRVFRFPPWARAQIISPESSQEVGEGEAGLIRIFDLANVYSVMAILTEDLGIRRGDGFDLIGRAEAAEQRGCSLMSV